MQLKRKKARRRGSRALSVLICLAAAVGVALGGALVWQNAQEALAVTDNESARKTLGPDSDAVSSEGPQLSPGDQDSSIGGGKASPPENTPASKPLVFAADINAAPSDDGANFAPEKSGEPEEDEEDDATPGAFAVDGQVAKTAAKKDNSYFDDAIFFGDSISTGITAYNIANNTACVAAIGVSPNTALTTAYIPTREGGKVTVLEAAKAYGERKKVYIMLGGNGLWQDKKSFISDYQKFIDAVREQYPGAIIYLQSMTPVAKGVEVLYPSVTHQKVLEYNAAIAELAAKNKLPFVNVFEALCGPDGLLPEGVSSDGLHLSAEYYFKWFEYLKSHTVEG